MKESRLQPCEQAPENAVQDQENRFLDAMEGIWDPPGHASLPSQKRGEAIAAAKQRAVAAAGGTKAGPKPQAKAKGRARVESRPRVQEAAASEVRVQPGALTASAAASRPQARSSRARIATGFGSEHCADWRAEESRREAAGVARGVGRREGGLRGRMTDMSGADLDRSAGGAWHAGRR